MAKKRRVTMKMVGIPVEPEPVPMSGGDDKARENLNRLAARHRAFSDSHLTDGGLRLELSNCCNASVTTTTGGLIYKVCSRCGREIRPTIYG